jgi:Ca-activated chloride channel homolog
MRYANPQYLLAYALVPLLVLGFLLLLRWKKKAISRLGDLPTVEQLIPEASRAKQVVRFVLFTLGMCFLFLSIIDPQVGSKEEEAKQEGIDLVVCLDVSNSMKAEDIAPSRLSRSIMAISKLIDRLHGDRIGIVVFAGDAFTQLPITSDYGSAKLMLDNIDHDIVPVTILCRCRVPPLAGRSTRP